MIRRKLFDDDESDGDWDDSSSDEDSAGELELHTVFDEVPETIEMPQAPEDIVLPVIKPIEGIEFEEDMTCSDKCKRCCKDWRWKWVIICILILAAAGVAVWLLFEQHKKIQADIDARTYGVEDEGCEKNPLIQPEQTLSKILWLGSKPRDSESRP